MPRAPAQPTISPSVAQTAYDPLAGTISGTSLVDEEEKLRIAREELAREEDAKRRLAAAEAERKRTEEAERRAQEERVRAAEQKRAEEQAREELRKREEERQRVEELVAKQTKAIEERLSKLAASIPPAGTAVVDPEATQVRAPGGVTVTENSYPTMVSAQAPAVVTAKKGVFPIIMIGLVIFILGAGGVGVWWLRSSRTPPGNNNLPPGTPAPENPKPPEPISFTPEFVAIPGGAFQMGRNGATVAEVPVHSVTVKPFQIDKTEVTNYEYQQFVKETKHDAPSNWVGGKPIPGQELLPVTFISIDDANAFAEWRSKRDGVKYRLPSEEEWEYAARGGDKDNIYSWGNTWVEGNAITGSSGSNMPKPVGSTPNDMIGNVYEWTSTKAAYYPGSTQKVEGEQQKWYVIRGASYETDQKQRPISATRRDWVSGNTRVSVLGFRLVRSE